MQRHSTLPKNGLQIAYLNICSLRNKIQDISEIPREQNLHILAISGTHIDSTIKSSLLDIAGVILIYGQNRNVNGGGVVIYVQSQIPVRVREDLGSVTLK